MATEAQLIARLKQEQQDYAVQALSRPDKRDEFEYGFRTGVLEGLRKAEELLLKLVKEENERDI